MKQNVILNMLHAEHRERFTISQMTEMPISEIKLEWNISCNNVAAKLRSEGLEASAKEAEKWKIKS